MATFKCSTCGVPSENIYYDDNEGKVPYKCARCSLKFALNTQNDEDVGKAVKAVIGQGMTWLKKKFKIGE